MKRAKQFIIRGIVLGLAVAAIAPATAQAMPVDMTGEDMRYLHAQAVAAANERQAAADARKAASQQRPRRPRIYDSRPARR
jgi:hypothetical protein